MALLTHEETHLMPPNTYQEAIKSKKWRLAIEETIEALATNNSWEFVERPNNVNLVST